MRFGARFLTSGSARLNGDGEPETVMTIYNLLAAGFLFFTALMVLFFFFMGILQWRENRTK